MKTHSKQKRRSLSEIIELARDVNEQLNGQRSVKTIGHAKRLIRRALVIDEGLREGLDEHLFPKTLVNPAAEILYSTEPWACPDCGGLEFMTESGACRCGA